MKNGPKPRVLAVDDTPANLVALEAVLGDRYEVISAHSGPQALAILERDPNVDVIIMDVMMPGMDGYQAAERIKKMPGCEDIPLVFITAVFREDPHIKRGYAVGAVDYFTKPFDPELLRFKVNVYASFRHRAQVLRIRERQLQESGDVLNAGRKLASVLEGLPVGVIIADVAGRICQTNDQVLRIIKCVTAFSGDAYGQVLEWWRRNEATLKHPESPLARSLESGEALHNQVVQVECLDGTAASLLESTSPLRGIDGSVVGAVVVLQDLTQHRQVEAEFEKRIARLVAIGVELEGASHGSAR
ncbi:MAG TPA: response regulator [Polyangiaceae bacterium]